jgi:hypothetical protein
VIRGTGAESTHMPGATRKLAVVAVLVVLAVLGGCIYTTRKEIRRYDELESNARKVITGPEIHTWGITLLEQYQKSTNLTVSQLGTNFPQQLKTLAPVFGPRVSVYQSMYAHARPYVWVYWNDGFREEAGFVITATNSTMGGPRLHKWSPGVFFSRQGPFR